MSRKAGYAVIVSVLALLVAFGCKGTAPGSRSADTASRPVVVGLEPKVSTPEETAEAWIKAMNEKDADALYAIYCSGMIAEIELTIEEARQGSADQKEWFCKEFGLAPDKLDTLTGKELHRLAVATVIVEQLDKRHGKDWKFAMAEPVDAKVKENEAAVKLALVVDGKKKSSFDMVLVKEDGVWKMGPRFPGLEGPGRANEAAAIGALKTLCAAQELHRARHGQYGDCTDLNDGKNKQYVDLVLVKADPDHPEHTPKSGYRIDISVNEDGTEWWAIATPVKWGVDGSRNFKVEMDGVIYQNTTEGDTTKFEDESGG